jgi:hypothetical protein
MMRESDSGVSSVLLVPAALRQARASSSRHQRSASRASQRIRPPRGDVRERYRATLEWQRLPDGLWLLQVTNEKDELVEGGIGDSPEDALLEVYERLIPPT